MKDKKIVFVLFPGAFGNRDSEYFEFWFQYVIAWITNWTRQNARQVEIIHVLYRGRTLEEHIIGALEQLQSIGRGAIVIPVCYSMGGQCSNEWRHANRICLQTR